MVWDTTALVDLEMEAILAQLVLMETLRLAKRMSMSVYHVHLVTIVQRGLARQLSLLQDITLLYQECHLLILSTSAHQDSIVQTPQ